MFEEYLWSLIVKRQLFSKKKKKILMRQLGKNEDA